MSDIVNGVTTPAVVTALENMIRLAICSDDPYGEAQKGIAEATALLSVLRAATMTDEQRKKYNAQVILACKGDCRSVLNLGGPCVCPCADDTDCLATGKGLCEITQETMRICKEYLGVKDGDG